jgi:hypothetical protein
MELRLGQQEFSSRTAEVSYILGETPLWRLNPLLSGDSATVVKQRLGKHVTAVRQQIIRNVGPQH